MPEPTLEYYTEDAMAGLNLSHKNLQHYGDEYDLTENIQAYVYQILSGYKRKGACVGYCGQRREYFSHLRKQNGPLDYEDFCKHKAYSCIVHLFKKKKGGKSGRF